MLIKYRENGMPELMEIVTVYRDKNNPQDVICVGAAEYLEDLRIRNIGDFDYKKLIEELYAYGKADLSLMDTELFADD